MVVHTDGARSERVERRCSHKKWLESVWRTLLRGLQDIKSRASSDTAGVENATHAICIKIAFTFGSI